MTHSFPTRRSSDLAPRSIQRPQPRRVGRGNVYGEIAREAGHRPRALGIIGDSVVRVLVCADRSEEHTSELQSLMRISYAVFCLKKKKTKKYTPHITHKKYIEHYKNNMHQYT